MRHQIILKSEVKGNYQEVFAHFDRALFEYLAPPKFVAQLLEYQGAEVGSLVKMKFGFPINQIWISEIVEVEHLERESFFIDIGRQLPLGLKKWHHKHRVLAISENSSLIVDEMTFECSSTFLTLINAILFRAAFLPRLILYPKYFNQFFS